MKNLLKYHIRDRCVLAREKYRLMLPARHKPILVFTMAKVGSTSIYVSLKKNSSYQVFHIHSLDEEEVERGIKRCFEKGVFPGSRTPVFLINSLIIQKNRPYKVITLLRNPIERNISAFFDAFELFLGMPAEHYTGSLEALEEKFYQNISPTYAIEWYDKQFRHGTGIDVYKTPFDKKKGFATLTKNHTEVLIIDNVLDDGLKAELIGAFCEIEDFKLSNRKVTATTQAADLYEAFRSHLKFTPADLSAMLESKYCHHFFSDAAIESLFRRWSK